MHLKRHSVAKPMAALEFEQAGGLMMSPSDTIVMAGHVTAEIYYILVMILSSSRESLLPVYYRFPYLILLLMMINIIIVIT